MTMAKMRAKMRVIAVRDGGTGPTGTKCENLEFNVGYKRDGYPADGTDEDNTFALFTPSADMSMTVTNPALVGTFKVGDTFYVDFIPVDQ